MSATRHPGADPGHGQEHDPLDIMYKSTADLRAHSIPSKRFHDAKTSCSAKRLGTPDSEHIYSRPAIYPPGYWSAPQGGKIRRLERQRNARIQLHQSTCLNIHGSDSVETDLWILPDFDEWEIDAEMEEKMSSKDDRAEWAPLVERAVFSNRERLRRSLEGDGWAFVGAKQGEEEQRSGHEIGDYSEGSVDEEFDLVVLPVVEVSCS